MAENPEGVFPPEVRLEKFKEWNNWVEASCTKPAESISKEADRIDLELGRYLMLGAAGGLGVLTTVAASSNWEGILLLLGLSLASILIAILCGFFSLVERSKSLRHQSIQYREAGLTHAANGMLLLKGVPISRFANVSMDSSQATRAVRRSNKLRKWAIWALVVGATIGILYTLSIGQPWTPLGEALGAIDSQPTEAP